MSIPESPTATEPSRFTRMPVLLTSRHRPLSVSPPTTKSTSKPVLMRQGRYSNLRMLSRSLISASTDRFRRQDEYAGQTAHRGYRQKSPRVSVWSESHPLCNQLSLRRRGAARYVAIMRLSCIGLTRCKSLPGRQEIGETPKKSISAWPTQTRCWDSTKRGMLSGPAAGSGNVHISPL
jgi:hypothetical protein